MSDTPDDSAHPIGVIGGGAWGTALAQALASGGHKVLLWALEPEVVNDINRNHLNSQFLPNISLSANITATNDLNQIAQQTRTFFVATPAHVNTEIATSLSPHIGADHTAVLCSKGLRESDGALLSDVWRESVPALGALAVLSGPSFAMEVAQGKPAALVLAARKQATIDHLSAVFGQIPTLRIYFSNDLPGVQIGGALKNIIAIASGLVDAMDLGNNARAALICRGLAEMQRFASAMGGRPETLAGLSGMGDVMLSATSPLSRNYRLGKRLGEGKTTGSAIKAEGGAVVEGAHTARIVATQAASHGLDLAIISAIDGILSGDITPQAAYELLMSRPPTWEHDNHDNAPLD